MHHSEKKSEESSSKRIDKIINVKHRKIGKKAFTPKFSSLALGAVGLPPEVIEEMGSARNLQVVFTTWQDSQHSAQAKLEFAARFGFNTFLEKLIQEHNIDVNETNALSMACLRHYETARILITKYNADVNKCGVDNETPLFNAIYSGNISLVRLLLDNRANVNAKRNFHDETPLHTCFRYLRNHGDAINTSYIPIMRLLIERGADTTIPYKLYGTTIAECIQQIEASPDLRNELEALFNQPVVAVDEFSTLLERHHLDRSNMDSLLAAFSTFTLEPCKDELSPQRMRI